MDLTRLSVEQLKALGFDQLLLAKQYEALKQQCDQNVQAIQNELQARARREQAQAEAKKAEEAKGSALTIYADDQ